MPDSKGIKFFCYKINNTEINQSQDRVLIRELLTQISDMEIADRDMSGLRLDSSRVDEVSGNQIFLLHFSKTRELAPGKRRSVSEIEGILLDEDEDFAEDVTALYCPVTGYYLMQSSVFFSRGMIASYFEEFLKRQNGWRVFAIDMIDITRSNGLELLASSASVQRFTFKLGYMGNVGATDNSSLSLKQVSEFASDNFGGSDITITIGNGRSSLATEAKNRIVSLFRTLEGEDVIENAAVQIRPDLDSSIEPVNLITYRHHHLESINLGVDNRPVIAERYGAMRRFYCSIIDDEQES